ncbi:hypothetical protein ACTXN4_07225 [Pseudomonas helleri]|uniref:hypothetical protein n=1 Tax=Pseudomonas helleri TaxID=1608996 RepID=UPI003FD321DC
MIDSMSVYEHIRNELKELVRLVGLNELFSEASPQKSVIEKRLLSTRIGVFMGGEEEVIKDFQEVHNLFDLEAKYKMLTSDHVLWLDGKSLKCHLMRTARVEVLLIKYGILIQKN